MVKLSLLKWKCPPTKGKKIYLYKYQFKACILKQDWLGEEAKKTQSFFFFFLIKHIHIHTVQKLIHSVSVALKSHCGGERDEGKAPKKDFGREPITKIRPRSTGIRYTSSGEVKGRDDTVAVKSLSPPPPHPHVCPGSVLYICSDTSVTILTSNSQSKSIWTRPQQRSSHFDPKAQSRERTHGNSYLPLKKKQFVEFGR